MAQVQKQKHKKSYEELISEAKSLVTNATKAISREYIPRFAQAYKDENTDLSNQEIEQDISNRSKSK